MSRKVLLLAGDFNEDMEIFFPFQAMQLLGHTVHAVCADKKKGEVLATCVHDFEGFQTYTEKRGHNFTLNYNFDDVNLEEYDGLIIPGGRAPEYMRLDERNLKIVSHFFDKNLPIAVICHGVQLLSHLLLHGRNLTCYPACSAEIKLAGGNYQQMNADGVLVDQNIVSAPAWPANGHWIREFNKILTGW